MAVFTPRGLKVRLPVPYVFALIARLHPSVSAFRVLKTTEGIESIPGFLAFLTGMIVFVQRETPLTVGLAALIAYAIGALVNHFGLHVVPGLVPLATLYSYVTGYGVLLVAFLIVGFICVGWQGVLSFFIGKGLGFFLGEVLDARLVKSSAASLGQALTSSERSFFNAYRMHASRLGVTTELSLADTELQEENWYPAFARLHTEWPEVTARFIIEDRATV